MSDGVRVWAVDESDSLKEMEPSKLDYEERIETWMCDNVSVLVPDDSGLLVIGRQVKTIFGGRIDLLCINGDGDLSSSNSSAARPLARLRLRPSIMPHGSRTLRCNR